MLTRQLVDLATKLPDYKENIQTKLRSIKLPTGGAFTKFSETFEELKKDLPGAEAPTQTVVRDAEKPKKEVLAPNDTPAAASMQVAEVSNVNPMGLVQYLIAPLLGPLGKAALVVLLVIFMLLRREDLRRRLIRLIGKGRISAATRAMDDAGARVSRYLLMQLLVNVSYGVPVAIGLLLHRRAQCCAVGRMCDGASIYPLHRAMDRCRDTGRNLAGRLAQLDDAGADDWSFRRARTAEQ